MTHAVSSTNTKRALAGSLRNAMEKKPFSKITITEIITECGVNRKTFYYHFQDIYALLKWMVQQDAIEIVKEFDIVANIEEAIHFVMNYVEQNDHLIACAYDSVGHDVLKSFFYEDFIAITLRYIEAKEHEAMYHLDDKYKNFLSHFYTEALSGMLLQWIKNRETVDKNEVVDHITKTINTSLSGLINKYGTSR